LCATTEPTLDLLERDAALAEMARAPRSRWSANRG
jgi:hypothetical protein